MASIVSLLALAAHILVFAQLPGIKTSKAFNGPPVEKGWQSVTSVPLWPSPNDPTATLILKRPPEGPGIVYAVGGSERLRTGTGFAKGDAARYAYRLVGWSKDGSTRVLGDRSTNRRGELRGLIGIRVERRLRAGVRRLSPGS
ncbi:hypothetical protein EON82_18985 [bacterium]|nr:MAG: hypothetical protein EON82_18985 [bacterium]